MNIDDKIKEILAARPWLKAVLSILFAFLSYGKAKELFVRQFGPK